MVTKRPTPSLLPTTASPGEFRRIRRQKFLTSENFRLNDAWLNECLAHAAETIALRRAAGNYEPLGQFGGFRDAMSRLRLHYTAGVEIPVLTDLFVAALAWFERWHVAHAEFAQRLCEASREPCRADVTPIDFAALEDFQSVIELTSVACLLGERSAVQQIAVWLRRYRNDDLLFETLLEPVTGDTGDVEDFYHAQPYDPLLDAVYTAGEPSEASAWIARYLDGWYRAFDGCSWHDTHRVQTDYMTPYNGYWAFEAAAICVIHAIDDAPFRDHLVYPKDLADWARSNHAIARLKSAASQHPESGTSRLRCEAGQACPRAGFWFTTAQAESRQRFAAGQTMPEIAGARWGATIWYWHEDQSAAP